MKRFLLSLSLAVLIAGSFWSSSANSVPAQAAADRILTSQSCSGVSGRVRVEFTWAGNEPGATQQWLDLSLENNGWLPGTFLGAGPLPAGANTFVWDGLLPNATHYVRLNQQLPSGAWDPSATFVFSTQACPLGSQTSVSPPAPGSTTIITVVIGAGGAPVAGSGVDIGITTGP